MARYRVGDKYLSEEEYQDDIDSKFVFLLFIVGCLVTGFLVNRGLVNPEWHTAIRFIVTVVPALFVGGLLAFFHRLVAKIILTLIIILILIVVVALIASVV